MLYDIIVDSEVLFDKRKALLQCYRESTNDFSTNLIDNITYQDLCPLFTNEEIQYTFESQKFSDILDFSSLFTDLLYLQNFDKKFVIIVHESISKVIERKLKLLNSHNFNYIHINNFMEIPILTNVRTVVYLAKCLDSLSNITYINRIIYDKQESMKSGLSFYKHQLGTYFIKDLYDFLPLYDNLIRNTTLSMNKIREQESVYRVYNLQYEVTWTEN